VLISTGCFITLRVDERPLYYFFERNLGAKGLMFGREELFGW
jgi:hypothetical protein